MNYRIEKDTMGDVQVPSEKYWGAQTQRSINNFKIGGDSSMPLEIIYGFAYLKKAAAHTNYKLEIYSKTDHGFAFPNRGTYNAVAAELHWKNLFSLFERNLKS